MKSVTIGNSVTSIGGEAFKGCSSLTSVTISNSVTSIGSSAFRDCSGLKSVTIPSSVTSIGNSAFEGCDSLSFVNIADLTSWCNIAFDNSTSNPLYYSHRIYMNGQEVTDLIIPDGVVKVREYAFYYCHGLTSVTIPENVTSIGNSAFYDCSGLTSVTIPNSMTGISSEAFSGCSSLRDVWCYAEYIPIAGTNAFYDSSISSATLHVPVASIEAYGVTKPWSDFGTIMAINSYGNNANIYIHSVGYSTFYDSSKSYVLPNGLSAKVVTNVSNNKLTYKTIAEGKNAGILPKGTAVILTSDGNQASTYTLTATESNASYSGTNLLHGSDEATMTTGNGYHYKLSYGQTGTQWNGVMGWYWGAQDGAPFQIGGHKAWLVVPNDGTRAEGFTVDGYDIEIIDMASDDEVHNVFYYDIQGRRISTPTRSGLYIKNGKKVIIK